MHVSEKSRQCGSYPETGLWEVKGCSGRMVGNSEAIHGSYLLLAEAKGSPNLAIADGFTPTSDNGKESKTGRPSCPDGVLSLASNWQGVSVAQFPKVQLRGLSAHLRCAIAVEWPVNRPWSLSTAT